MLLKDLSKVFDYISHDLIIPKLHEYGFDMLSLKLINSYLTSRHQRVKISNIHRLQKVKKQPSTSVLRKSCSEIYSKFTGEHSCRSVISIKLLWLLLKFIKYGIPQRTILVPVLLNISSYICFSQYVASLADGNTPYTRKNSQ